MFYGFLMVLNNIRVCFVFSWRLNYWCRFPPLCVQVHNKHILIFLTTKRRQNDIFSLVKLMKLQDFYEDCRVSALQCWADEICGKQLHIIKITSFEVCHTKTEKQSRKNVNGERKAAIKRITGRWHWRGHKVIYKRSR